MTDKRTSRILHVPQEDMVTLLQGQIHDFVLQATFDRAKRVLAK